jgi:hypothetical protein
MHPAEAYLPNLLAGNLPALNSLFSGDPDVNDPIGGHAHGLAEFAPYIAARHAWLTDRHARVEHLRTTQTAARSVVENLLHLSLPDGRAIALPLAVVGEHAPGDRLLAVRVYHSQWPLLGHHVIRPPLLKHDPALHVTDIVAQYQRALAAGDVDAIVDTFEPDGYFREPSGGDFVFNGLEDVRVFMTNILSAGGIGLEHCTVTDDGVACAIEFNAVAFGTRPIEPQAGVAVYERGPSGKLRGARIYDDVNVEAYLAGA